MSPSRLKLLLPCLCTLACSEPTDAPSGTGEQASSCAAALSVVIGETVEGAMTSLDDLDEPTLVHGPQGGQHLPLALRVSGLGPAPAPVLLEMEATLDGSDRLGGFLRELVDPRPDGSVDDAVWLELWLVVQSWPLDQVRVVSATVDELEPCDGTAADELTFAPE